MTNWNLINQVVKQTIYIYECEGITETTESIKSRTLEWYQNNDIADFKTLTAAVYMGKYNRRISYEEILFVRDCLF